MDLTKVEFPYNRAVPKPLNVVIWYCLSGEQFSICDTVATGSVVEALSCLGPRTCRARKKDNAPQQEYQEMQPLQNQ